MTQYEQRLEEDLEALRTSVLDLAGGVRENLAGAVSALASGDRDLAYRTILLDGPVNRSAERIEAACHRFIARHLPAAGHLRFVSAVMRLAVLLERIGDYATTICRESVQLQARPDGDFLAELNRMASDSLSMFEKALQAFASRDERLARSVMKEAETVDADFARAFGLLLGADADRLGMKDVFGRLIVIMQLERVSDQAKNLCEETVFAVTGEMKRRRPYRVLFLSDRDDAETKMAVAIGRRFHPTTGSFTSAGLESAGAVRDDVATFLAERGFDTAHEAPAVVATDRSDWTQYDVIVSLSGDVGRYGSQVPFHTVALHWDVAAQAPTLEARYRLLSTAVAELMETVRGPEPGA